MREETATIIALNLLSWLVAHPDRLDDFMATSGFEPSQLHARAADPDLLAAILEYLMSADDLLLKACTDIEITVQDVKAAHHCLSRQAPEFF